LEQLRVPTLVISTQDDPLAPYRFAAQAASRLLGARLVTIERGGHLFLGHDAEVRKEISSFVASAGPKSAGRAALRAPGWPAGGCQMARSA
jgi:pimeloyl-ACP methyl ester carboxylesterase